MAHLLVIENWPSGTGFELLRAILRLGHQFTFVTRDIQRYMRRPPPTGPHPILKAADVLTTETNDQEDLLALLRRQHRTSRFDGVVTQCDYYLDQTARVAEQLGLPGPGAAAMRRARQKHLMRRALAAAGVPNPRFQVTRSWEEATTAAAQIGYPLVLKPVDEGGGMFVTCVRDESELAESFERLAQFRVNPRAQPREPLFLLEQYLAGAEVSVEAYGFEGEVQVIGITDKSVRGFPDFIEDGHMFPAQLEPGVANEVVAFVRDALAAVGYGHGLAHVEVKLTPDGPRIVEINPRAAGNSITELIRRVAGVDLLEVAVQIALGQRPTPVRHDIGVASAAIKFILPSRAGRLVAIEGLDRLADDPGLVELTLKPVDGSHVEPPRENLYLGHVLYVDRLGLGARVRAEWAASQVELVYAEEPDVRSQATGGDGTTGSMNDAAVGERAASGTAGNGARMDTRVEA